MLIDVICLHTVLGRAPNQQLKHPLCKDVDNQALDRVTDGVSVPFVLAGWVLQEA
jgi:hypothetical protein